MRARTFIPKTQAHLVPNGLVDDGASWLSCDIVFVVLSKLLLCGYLPLNTVL